MDASRNGYLQVEIRGLMAIGHIYPPEGDGKRIDLAETEAYLKAQGLTGYDKKLLRQRAMSGEADEISLGLCNGLEFSETMYIKISLDRMKVTCRFLPPSEGGNVMNVQDILAQLESKGITYGIDQDAIMDFMTFRKYATDYVFAKGKPPRLGRDAKIEYFFNINPSLKPRYREDGSVDYRDLNTINNIEEGDLLARLIPEDPGENGRDVTGQDIQTRPVSPKRLMFGPNIRLSEDETELYSEVKGHVKLVDGKVFVSNLFEVPHDVDNSTGNIEFAGNVHVGGNVRGGFSIIARGDVIIEGVVEDALIQSGGQVIIKQGIHGMQKGIVDAESNVITQFIENATVFSGGYVETGSIIYSEVNAASDVIVNDRKGFIAGGVIRAGGKVESNTMGSSMGARTRIEVGMAPDKKEQYQMLQRDIAAKNQKISKLTPIIQTYQEYITEGRELDEKNEEYLNRIMDELEMAKTTLLSDREQFNELHQELLNSQHSKVAVRRDIFPGVTIVISDLTVTMKEKRSFCEFKKKNGEIQISNL